MKNSEWAGPGLFLLGASLLVMQVLPTRFWPDNQGWLSGVPRHESALTLGWREWQDQQVATRLASRLLVVGERDAGTDKRNAPLPAERQE
ncbi:hypothetical protein [Aeromonas enteropelogenes]|uniref:Uncharacterized protein n=1 Tax=Aeromonas enteropelogenes TaxID=29489 RepID=A0ABU9JBQ9_AEREN